MDARGIPLLPVCLSSGIHGPEPFLVFGQVSSGGSAFVSETWPSSLKPGLDCSPGAAIIRLCKPLTQLGLVHDGIPGTQRGVSGNLIQ